MSALEKIRVREQNGQMDYAEREVSLSNKNESEISMRRVACGRGGSAVSAEGFVSLVGSGKTEGFSKDGLSIGIPTTTEDGEEVEVLAQSVVVKDGATIARIAQDIGLTYGIRTPEVDALVDQADQADQERAENARILAEHKADQAATKADQAENGLITPEMIELASKGDLVAQLRERGETVSKRDGIAKLKDRALSVLVNS